MICALAWARISSPGRQWARVAVTLHMVPDGMNTAASLPSRSATRSHSRFTVGSSPICSSPTSARAIASRIAGVGPRLRVRQQVDADGIGLGIARGRGVVHGEFFLAHIVMAGQKHASGARVKVGSSVYLYIEVAIEVCINTHEFEGHNLRVEGGRLGAGRPKRKSCPVQASGQTGAGDGASPAERYPDGNVQKHRKASRSEAERRIGIQRPACRSRG